MQPSHSDPASAADRIPALSADELRSPEEVLERRQRRRWLMALPLVAALAVGLWFGSRPALHAVKAWQARRASAEAERLTGEHKWLEAKAKLEDAMLLWRQEPAASRAAAIFFAAVGNSRDAANFWKQVELARPLTVEEQRDYAESLLGTGELGPAETHLRKAWPPGQAGGPRDWEIGMKLAIRRDHGAEAIDLAHQLLASPSTSARQRLDASMTLLYAGNVEGQSAGWAEIRALAQNRASAESLEALLLLARRAASISAKAQAPAPADDFPTLPALIGRIEAHPLAKIQHRLLTLDLQIAQDPRRRAEWIQTAMDRFAGTKDDADLAILGAWLYAKGEYGRVLEAIPAARAPADRALFFQRMDALGALSRWEDIREAIQSGKIALDPMIEQMYLARCAEKLDEPRARDAHWDAAIDAAGNKPEKLVQLGQYAAKNGAAAVASKALRAAVQAAPDSRDAYEALVSLLETQGETLKLQETLRTMLGIWPQDPAVRNDAAYIDALLDTEVPAALATAKELVRAEPASLPHRITLALAELRSGNALAALDAFGGVRGVQTNMLPRQRAVYAAALWAASYNHEAHESLDGVRAADLLPEERVLVKPIEGDAEPGK